MIAAISPAASNHEETTTTLKFAQRVSAISTTAKADVETEENLKDKLSSEISDLKAQLDKLKKEGVGANIDDDDEDDDGKNDGKKDERARL